MDALTKIGLAFPPPAYLSFPAAGIDIGTNSVKAVMFKTHIGPCLLRSFAEVELKDGVVIDGDIEEPEALVEVLRSIRLRERVRFAHASLPERKAYLYQTLVPLEAVGDLRDAVEFSLESHVPLAPSETVFDFEVVRKVSTGFVVSVTAYARRVVELYAETFSRSGIELRSLEIESQALGRALWDDADRKRTLIAVDFGRKTTRIAVFDHGVVGFTATLDVGGDTLTAAIMKHFGITEGEAEHMKNEKGFLQGEQNRELYESLVTTASVLRDEVSRHITYWNTPSDEPDTVPRKNVEAIVLVGGNANLKGLPEYLSRSLNLPVSVGNVWKNAIDLDEYVPPMPLNQSLEFATTIGLAVRSCNCRAW